ncbi:MAG: D-aminoacyl-tRNA deacylase [Myxococcales bacterium]
MRAVVQRVHAARVTVGAETTGAIEQGLLVYLGAGKGDDARTSNWMALKLAGLRIFEDSEGKMSLSVSDIGGSVLVVSQFTLYGDVRKGRRPSFDSAAPPDQALVLYESVCAELRELGLKVETGRFRATMEVHARVAGPVTILIDSERTF